MNTIQFFTDENCVAACDLIDSRHGPVGAKLFEIHMFLVDVGNGHSVWYGSLLSVNNREKHYFKGWSGLVTNLRDILTPIAQLEVLESVLSAKELLYITRRD